MSRRCRCKAGSTVARAQLRTIANAARGTSVAFAAGMAFQTISNHDLAHVAGGAGEALAAGAAGAWTGLSIGKYLGHPVAGAATGGVIGAAAVGVARRDPWCYVPAVPAAVAGFAGGGPLGATAAAAGACAGGTVLHDEYNLLGKR